MQQNYSKKIEPIQKATKNTASSVLDASSQSEALQRKANMASNAAQREEAPRPNNTGMPDNLKSGIESLSGFSMDDVRVHYNSSKPATVQALAYTQGTDIHVAPGQEKHLPHEAWHVAQQMAGRVSPTTNINGTPVNDNAGLEHEADVMGEKAVQCKGFINMRPRKTENYKDNRTVFQRRTEVTYNYKTINYSLSSPPPGRHKEKITEAQQGGSVIVGCRMHAKLDPNDKIKGTVPNDEQKKFMKLFNYFFHPLNSLNKERFVKGHLLNHNLGGLGIACNLAPLTHSANNIHDVQVEEPLKKLIENGFYTEYSVEATVNNDIDFFNKDHALTFFTCTIIPYSRIGPSPTFEAKIKSGPNYTEGYIDNPLSGYITDFISTQLEATIDDKDEANAVLAPERKKRKLDPDLIRGLPNHVKITPESYSPFKHNVKFGQDCTPEEQANIRKKIQDSIDRSRFEKNT